MYGRHTPIRKRKRKTLHAYKNKDKLLYSQKACEYFNWITEK
jgi:hypothetical protein